jgi:hypothetical protein
MLATVLMVASAAILFVAGALHLKATFFDSDLLPRDPALQKRMREVSPGVTQETDMWSCWIGFNAGLSIGFMLYGLVYGFLAISHSSLLFGSPYLLVVGLLTAGGYVALSKAYMFRFPLVITGVSLACFVSGVIVSLT